MSHRHFLVLSKEIDSPELRCKMALANISWRDALAIFVNYRHYWLIKAAMNAIRWSVADFSFSCIPPPLSLTHRHACRQRMLSAHLGRQINIVCSQGTAVLPSQFISLSVIYLFICIDRFNTANNYNGNNNNKKTKTNVPLFKRNASDQTKQVSYF